MRAKIRRLAVAGPVAMAVVVAVAGCSQAKLGAVALYGGNHRITSVQLADEVANLNTGYQEFKGKAQIPYKPPEMSRQVLSWLLRFATVEKMGARAGITVTPAQAQAELASEAARAKQAGDTLREVAVLNGLPPDQLAELGRWFSIQVQLEKKFDGGTPPKTSAAQARLQARLGRAQCLAAKSLRISVNPQYGAYNYVQFNVVPSVSMLSATPGKPASPPAGQHPQC